MRANVGLIFKLLGKLISVVCLFNYFAYVYINMVWLSVIGEIFIPSLEIFGTIFRISIICGYFDVCLNLR